MHDLETRADITVFVDAFYDSLLQDDRLATIFLDVADVELSVHKPHIIDYWEKLLLDGDSYQRHTMNIHRNLNDKRPLNAADFDRWLQLFVLAMDSLFSGAKAQQAKTVAGKIAANMQLSFR